jgi:hypothetical protein
MVMLEVRYSATDFSLRVMEQPAAERSAEASDSSNACSAVRCFQAFDFQRMRPLKTFFLPFFSMVSSPR